MTIFDVSLITQITSGAYGGGVLALCYKQLANGQLNSMEIGRKRKKNLSGFTFSGYFASSSNISLAAFFLTITSMHVSYC